MEKLLKLLLFLVVFIIVCSEKRRNSEFTVAKRVAELTSSAAPLSFITLTAPPPTVEEKQRNRKIRPVIAGFAKFAPSPPKRHFTTTIANAAPTTHCHTGTSARTLRPRRRPVTIAVRSLTDCSLFVITLK